MTTQVVIRSNNIQLVQLFVIKDIMNINSSQQSRAKNQINNTVIDYRNGKYQGTIQPQTRLPNGIGMFLSQDYYIALGFWKQGRIQGECFTLYPNGNIYFGIFSKGQPKQMSCFQFSNGKILYSFTNNIQDCIYLVDNYNKSITVVRMHRDSRKQFFENMNQKKINYSTDVIKQGKGVFFRKKIQIIQQVKYQNQLQKWMKIQEYSKQVIKSQFKDYKSFIRFNFCNLPESQLELTQTKQEIQLRFKKSSLICHIIQKNNNQNMLRCKLIGYYDESKRKVEILRKMGQGIQNRVQEIYDQDVFSYTNKRPLQAKQKLIDYFKKSTHFVNTYIKSRELQVISIYFQSLYEIIDNQISSKKAQTLLELGQAFNQASPIKEKYNRESRYTQNLDPVSIHEVTNETLEKINRKNANNFSKAETIDRRTNYNNIRLDYKSPNKYEQSNQFLQKKSIYKYEEAKENYYSPQKPRGLKYAESSPTLRQKNYLAYAEGSSPYQKNRLLERMKGNQSPPRSNNKRYAYITNHNNSTNDHQSHQKLSKKKMTLDLYHSKSDYLWIQEQNYNEVQMPNRYENPNRNRESIKKLAKDYELINQKITVQKQNKKDYEAIHLTTNKYNQEKSKSPKKYTYPQSPMYSPSSQSQKGKKLWR